MLEIIRNNVNPDIGFLRSIMVEDFRSLSLLKINPGLIKTAPLLWSIPQKNYSKDELELFYKKEKELIYLDIIIMYILLENPSSIPEDWKNPINGDTKYICFEGTLLKSFNNVFCLFSLFWNDIKWDFKCFWLEALKENHVSAVIKLRKDGIYG